MVNISKRMHKLMPRLLQVKGGPGAATIPSDASIPQLTSVTLRLPHPASGHDESARTFWRSYLPGFKYHNIAVPITVEQKHDVKHDYAPTLTLNFEATTQEAFKKQDTTPKLTDTESLSQAIERLQESRSEMRASGARGTKAVPVKQDSWKQHSRSQQEKVGIPKEHATSIGAVTLKPQPAADPSKPSTTTPPTTLYQRSITLGLRGRREQDIWTWFQNATGAQEFQLSEEDRASRKEQSEHKDKARTDRKRVKTGIDAVKHEQAELKRAKEAADRIAAE